MTDPFTAPDQPIPRDRFNRPLVVPPGGGKQIAYTRATTYVGCLEDGYNLSRWQMRMVATGLADRPDLLLAVAAHRGDRDRLNDITQQSLDAAKAGAAATTGTALHALTERIDRGEDTGVVPDAYTADLDAYTRETAALQVCAIEQFRVEDELRVGGTTDRIVEYGGRHYIADVKSGSNVDYGMGKIAMQLAIYAHATPYDHITRRRNPDPVDVDLEHAIVIHLPAGTGTCELRWVDIAAGWDAVTLATRVRAWRARKDLASPFTATPQVTEVPTTAALLSEVLDAASVDDLMDIYRRAQAGGYWNDTVRQACTNRKNQLTTAA